MRGRTGVRRPFTSVRARSSARGLLGRAASQVGSLTTVSPSAANCCSRWHRFTASPTSVYSRRSSEPSSAAATSPVDSADAEPERREALGGPLVVDRAPGRRASRAAATSARSAWSALRLGRAEHRHHRVADVLHHGAAPPRIARFIAARWRLSCAASGDGSACSAIVE